MSKMTDGSKGSLVSETISKDVAQQKRFGGACIDPIGVTRLMRMTANISPEHAASEISDHSSDIIRKALQQMDPEREREIREALIILTLKITEGLRTTGP